MFHLIGNYVYGPDANVDQKYKHRTIWHCHSCRLLILSMTCQWAYLKEWKSLNVIKMLFSWCLRDRLMCPMCHAFHFPSTFPQLPSIHPFFTASGFHYLPHSLHFYAYTFLLPHFTHPVYSLICIPNSLFFRAYFPLVYLLGWLRFYPPPLQPSLVPPTSYFLSSLSLPRTTTTTLSMGKRLCFPLLWSTFQIVPVKKSQLHK